MYTAYRSHSLVSSYTLVDNVTIILYNGQLSCPSLYVQQRVCNKVLLLLLSLTYLHSY